MPPGGASGRMPSAFTRRTAQRWLELHLEVPESLTLEEAHRQATLFENDVRAGVPGLTRIVSHLEPVGDNTAIRHAEPADAAEVLAAVDEFFHGDASVAQLHNVKVQRPAGRSRFPSIAGSIRRC